jgi:hypothetical protein
MQEKETLPALFIRWSRAATRADMTPHGLAKVAARDPERFPQRYRFTPAGYTYLKLAEFDAYLAAKAVPTGKREPPHDPSAARAARTAKAARRAAEGDKAAA